MFLEVFVRFYSMFTMSLVVSPYVSEGKNIRLKRLKKYKDSHRKSTSTLHWLKIKKVKHNHIFHYCVDGTIFPA